MSIVNGEKVIFAILDITVARTSLVCALTHVMFVTSLLVEKHDIVSGFPRRISNGVSMCNWET